MRCTDVAVNRSVRRTVKVGKVENQDWVNRLNFSLFEFDAEKYVSYL